MTETDFTFRAGRKQDAKQLAELINFAGEGLPHFFWSRMAEPGQDAWEIGAARAAREHGSFSYVNTEVVEVNGAVVARAFPGLSESRGIPIRVNS